LREVGDLAIDFGFAGHFRRWHAHCGRDRSQVAGVECGESGSVISNAKSWELRATLSMARLWCDQGKPAADHRTIKAAARRTPPTAASSGNCQKEGPEG
jgi:hypothetical protein